MKVLFVSSATGEFEISTFVKSQGESLKELGVDLDYFLIQNSGLKGYLKAVYELRKRLKNEAFDIIHAHYVYCGCVALLSSPKCPVVVSFLGSDLKGVSSSSFKSKLTGKLSYHLSRIVQLFANRIIVKSEEMFSYSLLKKKTEIIPNGVNMKIFRPIPKIIARRQLNLSQHDKLVLFLGNRKNENKNFVLLKSALQLLDDEIKLIEISYPITRDQVVCYLNATDVFILTSKSEGSPNTIKEAMACNCPIISTNVGDVGQIISQTDYCYLSPFDPQKLAVLIEKSVKTNQRTTGRQDIGHLEISKVAKRILKLYRQSLTEYQS